MTGDPYVYPGTRTLTNLFGITDFYQLESLERQFTTQRARAHIPKGIFDLKHLRAIHKHLFQDIYGWAGEIRKVEISKGENQFMLRRYIESGMRDIHKRLVEQRFLARISREKFAAGAGILIGDINYVHPFREGNGRTQIYYLQQLAEQAGHALNIRALVTEEWMAASKLAHSGHYDALKSCIFQAIIKA